MNHPSHPGRDEHTFRTAGRGDATPADAPRYDYVCGECGATFEATAERGVADGDKHCPTCGSRSVRQTFGSFLRNAFGGCGSDRDERFRGFG